MAVCWYCFWGWPQEVWHIYARARADIGAEALHFGPAHVVWEDENFDTASIAWCIEKADTYRGDLSDDALAIVLQSLRELLDVPESTRVCIPKDYDSEHPDKFPPPNGLKMIARHA